MTRILSTLGLVAALATITSISEAGWNVRIGYGGGYGGGYNGGYSSGYHSGYGGGVHHVQYPSHGYGHGGHHYQYHQDGHYDYHPTEIRRHRGHFHVQPGHYDWHDTSHWDLHHHHD